jgi:hypothetical protein
VHHEPVRQQERVVGTPTRLGQRRLPAVVHPFEEAAQPEHVLGHAFTPLAPGLLARERFAQLSCVLAERVQPFVLALQLVRELAERAATVRVEAAHELADLAELGRHHAELLVDERLLAVELGGGAAPFVVEMARARLVQPV